MFPTPQLFKVDIINCATFIIMLLSLNMSNLCYTYTCYHILWAAKILNTVHMWTEFSTVYPSFY